MEPTWIAASAAVISSGAAIWSARNGNRTLKRADRDGQARSRPMVVAELRDEPHADGTQLLVIRNYGPTVARNVVVTFDPALPDPEAEKAAKSLTPFLKSRYAEPIPVLAPGTELDNVWFSGTHSDDGSGWVNFEPLPDKVTITITYLAPDGMQYSDEYHLDVGIIRTRTYVSGGTHHPKTQRKEALRSLKAIEGAMTHIAKKMPKNDNRIS